LTTEKPQPHLQLLWAITAEWILELRLDLWEELHSVDTEFTKQFSTDLDTLRGLTHYVSTSLPSVYLYEACLRLITKSSPSRTQQLLDASLRNQRLNSSRLICHGNKEEIKEDCVSKRRSDKNLIREKRKAIALYLRCKHLPGNMMTCPGEKAGMLREALKCLEVVGEGKKVGECLEMVRGLGGVNIY